MNIQISVCEYTDARVHKRNAIKAMARAKAPGLPVG